MNLLYPRANHTASQTNIKIALPPDRVTTPINGEKVFNYIRPNPGSVAQAQT
jgi:hypothetical protein